MCLEVKKQTVSSEYIGSSFAGRRKSGLKPIRPGEIMSKSLLSEKKLSYFLFMIIFKGGNFAEKDPNSSLWSQTSFYGGSSTSKY